MEATSVRVWDVFVRVFHWALVLCIGIAWASAYNTDSPIHNSAGYLAGGLVLCRVIWGFIGTRYARFSQFVCSPPIVIRYLRDIVAHREARYLGHNPAGGAMIVILMLMVAATCISGLMLITDAFWGVSWVQELHGFVANSVLFLVALHIGGVVVASLRHRENLVRAMLNGRKRRLDSQ
jgi:cytochrome b